jgi:hypothetical protein
VAFTGGVKSAVRDYLDERISAPVAVARLLFHVAPERLDEVLAAYRVAEDVAGRGGERLRELRALAAAHRDGIARVHGLIREHEKTLARGSGADLVDVWRGFFDASVALSPEGSVAAFSLGSPELLELGTREVVSFLESGGLLGGGVSLLEIGCGIGRLAERLAPRVARYHGTDISLGMLAAARRRVAGHPNATLSLTAGRGLAELRDASFDVVIAVDSFPYVHHAGAALVDVHFAEAFRVLGERGRFALFNYSYGGDLGEERVEVREVARQHGFAVDVCGVKPFRVWDGALYLMRKGTQVKPR